MAGSAKCGTIPRCQGAIPFTGHHFNLMPKKPKNRTDAEPTKPALKTATALGQRAKGIILEWQRAQTALEEAKENEAKLRTVLADMFFPFETRSEGTNRLEGIGFVVTVGHKLSRKIEEAPLAAVEAELLENGAASPVKFKPSLDLEAYRALTPEQRKIFDQALTIKDDGLPTLEIKLETLNDATAPEASGLESEPEGLRVSTKTKGTPQNPKLARKSAPSRSVRATVKTTVKKTVKSHSKPAAKKRVKK